MDTDWSLIISVIALVVSLATALLSIWHNRRLQKKQHSFERKFRQVQVIEEAKIKIIENTDSINGLLNMDAIDASLKADLMNIFQHPQYNEIFILHANNRRLYRGIKHHFSSESQAKLDHTLDEIDLFYSAWVDGKISSVHHSKDSLLKVSSFSKILVEELDKIIDQQSGYEEAPLKSYSMPTIAGSSVLSTTSVANHRQNLIRPLLFGMANLLRPSF